MAHVLLTWHYTYKIFEVVTGSRFSRTAGYLHSKVNIKKIDNTFFYMCLCSLHIKMDGTSTECSIWSSHCISNISRQKEIFFLLRLFFQYEGREDQTLKSSSPASMRSVKLQQGYPAPPPKVSAHARVDSSLLVKQKPNKPKQTWWRVLSNYKISQAHNILYRANY